MKKLLLFSMLLFTVFFSKAQSGNNQIGIGPDLGIPLGEFSDGFKFGFGGYLKGLYGIGNSGQVTFTTGYTTYKAKESTSDVSAHMGIIPLLLGYRYNMTGFYIEPQAGYGIYSFKVKFMGQSESSSDGAFTYAAGIGYANNKFDFGIRYQGATKNSDGFGLMGVHFGYNFSAGPANKK